MGDVKCTGVTADPSLLVLISSASRVILERGTIRGVIKPVEGSTSLISTKTGHVASFVAKNKSNLVRYTPEERVTLLKFPIVNVCTIGSSPAP